MPFKDESNIKKMLNCNQWISGFSMQKIKPLLNIE